MSNNKSIYRNKEFRPFIYALLFLIFLLAAGTTGYVSIENYSWFDGLYMTLITVSTIGYGEIHPLSDNGRLFTSLLIIFTIAFATLSASTITRYIVSGIVRDYFKLSKVKKEIDQLKDHVIVVGYGRNGAQSVEELKSHHIPVVVIEQRENKVREIQTNGNIPWLNEDPTADETLLNAGIKKAKALITVMPTDEENLFIVLSARELCPKLKIITRAINPSTVKKLKTAGASHVIVPDKISGQHMAKMIAQPEVIEFLYLLTEESSSAFSIQEIMVDDYFMDKNMNVSTLRNQLLPKLNIIGIKLQNGQFEVELSETLKLSDVYSFLLIGQNKIINEYKHKYLKR
jgi:voltage-gated potassium channel